ncbi:YlbG family protein [Hydrogenibacillus schlegelii]|nr:YlbG family protein [Hydrogenibacillus schlegelii]
MERTIAMEEQVALAVWLDHPRSARHLRRYGLVHYVSERFRYAVLYVERRRAPAVIRALRASRFVVRVEPSPYREAVEAIVNLNGEARDPAADEA